MSILPGIEDKLLHAVVKDTNAGNYSIEATSRRRLSATAVLIETPGSPGFSIYSLPPQLSGNLALQTILGYAATPAFVKQNTQAKKKFINYFRNFADYLIEQDVQNQPLTTLNIRGYIAEVAIKGSKYLASDHFQNLRRAFFTAAPFVYGPAIDWPDDVKATFVSFKSIKAERNSGKTPPIGKYLGIPNSKFTNKELLFGLRLGALWTLRKIHEMRSSLCSSASISACLQKLKGKPQKDYRAAFKGFVDFKTDPDPARFNHELITEVGGAIWANIASAPLMAEWQFYSFNLLKPLIDEKNFSTKGNFSPADYKLLLESFILPDGNINKRPKTRPGNDLARIKFRPHMSKPFSSLPITRPILWAEELVTHTILEKLLIVWLLATERGQTSGISKLKVPDILYGRNKSTLQISTTKLRLASYKGTLNSKPDETAVLSQIYRRNSPPYNAYDTWLKQIQTGKEFISDYNQGNDFIYEPGKRIQGLISSACSPVVTQTFTPLLLIATKDTEWQKSFISEMLGAEREAAAFIEILQNRLSRLLGGISPHSLPPSVIGQSLVVEVQLENNNSNSSSTVESKSVGHSPSTGRNVYKDRFYEIGIAEIIEPVAAFSRRVGNDKIELAWAIASRLRESSEKVTLEELETISGITNSSRIVQNYLTELDEDGRLAITGEILCGDRTLIVQTDITAAQIIGYVNHLEKNLPALLQSARHDTAIKHLSKLIYLRSVLNEFPVHLQEQGRRLSEEMAFPFPPLD